MPTGLGDEQLWLCPTLDNSASDLSGNGNQASIDGNTVISGVSGSGGSKAFESNGTNYSGLTVSNSSTMGFAGDLSWSFWINLNQINPNQYFVAPKSTNGFNVYDLSKTTGQSSVRVRVNHGTSTPVNAGTLSQSTWHHVVVTRAGDTWEAYIDGSSVGSGTQSINSYSHASTILMRNASGAEAIDGYMDDIRKFDRVLGSSEITHLASARGVQGSPYTATGIGDEKLWLCPSLDDSPDDISGNNHHGTYNGSMGTVADTNVGGTKAYSFDGTDDFINCGSSIDTTAPLSVSCWFNSDQVRNFQGLVSRSASSSFPNFILYTHGSSEVGTYISAHRRTSSLVATGNWYHTCFTLDANGNLDLYFNGSLVRSDTSVSMSYSAAFDLLIGDFQSATGSDYPHDGLMDDIRIFGRVLSETEIDHLGTSRGIEGNPYQYNGLGDEKLWLCPSLNDSADDLSGSGNHGTYNGGMGTVLDDSEGGIKAYSFDGSNDYLDFGDILDAEVWTAGDFAISGWVKSNGWNTVQVLNKYHQTSGQRQFQFRVLYSNGQLNINAYIHTTLGNVEYRYWLGSTSLSKDTWYHVVLNYDSSAASDDRATCFINGVSETMTIPFTLGTLSTVPNGTASLAAGARVSGSSAQDFRSGYSDDIRIFNRQLTTSEITALASKRGYRNLTGPHPHPLTVAIEHPLG